MKVPKRWKDVSVAQYQHAMPYYKQAIEETDSLKSLEHWSVVIAILTDSQLDAVQSLDIGDLKKVINKLSFLSDNKFYGSRKHLLYLKGGLYKAPKEAKEFKPSRYIDYKTFLGREGGMVANLHLILATLYTPYVGGEKDFMKRAELFKTAMIGDVYPVVFFYSIVYKALIKNMTDSGLKQVESQLRETQVQVMEILRETLEDIGDGTVPSMR